MATSTRRQQASNALDRSHAVGNWAAQSAERIARQWIHGIREHWLDIHELSQEIVTGTIGPGDWLSEVTALYINCAARMLGSGPWSDLSFDSAAEMAGPLTVRLPAKPMVPAVPSALTLTSTRVPRASEATTPSIPVENVMTRVPDDGRSVIVTLTNLGAIQKRLIPGVYSGVITFGSVTVPISATRF